MSAIDEFNPAPAPDYETLLFQFKALCRMYNSTRNQCSFMAKTICDLNKQIADGALDAVESERAANAQLTAELESLRQERDGLLARVAELEDYIQCTPEAIECRYNGECEYKSPAALSKIKAEAVREAVSFVESILQTRDADMFRQFLEEYANQMEADNG